MVKKKTTKPKVARKESIAGSPSRTAKKKSATGKKGDSAAKKSNAGKKKTAEKSDVLEPEVIPAPPLGKERKKKTADSEKALVKFDPLQRYLSEISTYQLLTREEERELGIRVREHGDKEAAYALVTSNLRLVVKIALEFQRVWMQNLLDLIQEGNIGCDAGGAQIRPIQKRQVFLLCVLLD